MPELLSVLSVSNTPVRITDSKPGFYSATFYGLAGFNASGIPSSNLSNVYIGINSGRMITAISPGGNVNWALVPAHGENLHNFWMHGQSGDGIYVVYY